MIDLTGQTFGNWTVIDRARGQYYYTVMWWCCCSCGTKKIVAGAELRRGRSKSCGHRQDLVGQIFGEWTVIKRAVDRGAQAMWLCRCSCGKERNVLGGNLTRMDKGTRSCGHGFGYIDAHGYRRLSSMSDHPNAYKNGSIFEHVVVMTEILGRPLVAGENVHHKNGIRDDNRRENLELWVVSQPSGQRIDDLIDYIARYHTEDVIHRVAELTAKGRYRSVADPAGLELAM